MRVRFQRFPWIMHLFLHTLFTFMFYCDFKFRLLSNTGLFFFLKIFLSEDLRCITAEQTQASLLGQSRVKVMVPRRGLQSRVFFVLLQWPVPQRRHPEWCGCKEAWTEFFIIGPWDFQSLSSNQVHMPIVMDFTPQRLCPRQRTHTQIRIYMPSLSWSINIYSWGLSNQIKCSVDTWDHA